MKRINFKEYDEDFADEVFPLVENGTLHIVEKSKAEEYGDLILRNYPNRLGRVQFSAFVGVHLGRRCLSFLKQHLRKQHPE